MHRVCPDELVSSWMQHVPVDMDKRSILVYWIGSQRLESWHRSQGLPHCGSVNAVDVFESFLHLSLLASGCGSRSWWPWSRVTAECLKWVTIVPLLRNATARILTWVTKLPGLGCLGLQFSYWLPMNSRIDVHTETIAWLWSLQRWSCSQRDHILGWWDFDYF